MSRRNARSEEASLYRRWYGLKAWLDRRERQLQAYPYCKMCEEEGKCRLATVVDHRVPHKGDWQLFTEGELDSLCSSHHNSVKQSLEKSGLRIGFDDDGSPLDPKHPWYRSEAE